MQTCYKLRTNDEFVIEIKTFCQASLREDDPAPTLLCRTGVSDGRCSETGVNAPTCIGRSGSWSSCFCCSEGKALPRLQVRGRLEGRGRAGQCRASRTQDTKVQGCIKVIVITQNEVLTVNGSNIRRDWDCCQQIPKG